MTDTEPDVIARVLDDNGVNDSSYLAQLIFSALIERRMKKDYADLCRRRVEGLA